MAEVIDLEELRRIGFTLKLVQADQASAASRLDGIERRLAIGEERQAELETIVRLFGQQLGEVDRKLDVVTALVREDVAQLEAKMEARFALVDARLDAMDARFDQVLAAIAAMRPPSQG